jgi:hypothetical protein
MEVSDTVTEVQSGPRTAALKFNKLLYAVRDAESPVVHAYFANISKSLSWPCAAIADHQQAESCRIP